MVLTLKCLHCIHPLCNHWRIVGHFVSILTATMGGLGVSGVSRTTGEQRLKGRGNAEREATRGSQDALGLYVVSKAHGPLKDMDENDCQNGSLFSQPEMIDKPPTPEGIPQVKKLHTKKDLTVSLFFSLDD